MDKLLKRKDKFIEKVLKKMFQLVGAKYSKKFCKQPEWYLIYSWDEKTEKKWKEFFIKSAQNDLKLSKKAAEKEFLWFNLCYGWKKSPKGYGFVMIDGEQ